MDQAALDAGYNNSAAVANSAQIVAGWQKRSAALRADFPAGLDLRYGSAERSRIDYFEAKPGAPLLVYIHGGYWQMRAKEDFAFVAAGPLAHGINVALAGYTLAPQQSLDGIVSEIFSALDFLAQRHGSIYVSGWSAGGHLTAMAMNHPAVEGGLAISGLYDLEPIRLSYLNEKLGLDEEAARRNSPLLHLPGKSAPLYVTYGKAELPELQRQSDDYGRAWREAGLPGKVAPLEGHDHFSLLEELASPQGALTALARTLLDG
jgi:acetyl esterase/lipase